MHGENQFSVLFHLGLRQQPENLEEQKGRAECHFPNRVETDWVRLNWEKLQSESTRPTLSEAVKHERKNGSGIDNSKATDKRETQTLQDENCSEIIESTQYELKTHR